MIKMMQLAYLLFRFVLTTITDGTRLANRLKLFVIPILIIACNKEDNNINQSTTTNNSSVVLITPGVSIKLTPIPPTSSGKIHSSTNYLKLHIGNTGSVSAKLYNSDGTLVSLQPGFTWSVDNNSALTVSNGNVTATNLGEALINVGDQSHGSGYIQVSVVPDTVAIPSGPANIVFEPYVLSLKPGSPLDIPAYIITDFKGISVSATPTFEVQEQNSGITISGKTITASKQGIFHLLAKHNDNSLYGNLILAVNSSELKDYIITSFQSYSFPSIFNSPDLTADPIKISVFEFGRKNNIFFLDAYETSPDQIAVDYPSVMIADGNGSLKSLAPGYTSIQLVYKTAFITGIGSVVRIKTIGNWGAKGSDGTSYNFCFLDPFPVKYGLPYGFNKNGVYDDREQSGNANIASGNGMQAADKCSFLGGIRVEYLPGQLKAKGQTPGNQIGQLLVSYKGKLVGGNLGDSGFTGYLIYWNGDNNKLILDAGVLNSSVNGTKLNLVNGTGDCTASTASTACQLSKTALSRFGITSTLEATIIYGSDNKPTFYTFTKTVSNISNSYNINYDADGRIVKFNLVGSAGSIDEVQLVEFTYTSSNKYPDSRNVTLTTGEYFQYKYSYNSYGQLNRVDQSIGYLSSPVIKSYYVYAYPNTVTKNPSSVDHYSDGAKYSTTDLTWDDKKLANPFFDINANFDIPNFTNNVTSNTLTCATASLVCLDRAKTIVSTYQYNSNGYPIQVTSSDSAVIKYTYNNCN